MEALEKSSYVFRQRGRRMAKPGRDPAHAEASRQYRISEKPETVPGDGAQEEGVPSTGLGGGLSAVK